MNHSSIGHSDEVMLALRKPEILLYLTTNRMLLGDGVNKSLKSRGNAAKSNFQQKRVVRYMCDEDCITISISTQT